MPFKKGQSGNPKGRPKGGIGILTPLIRAALDKPDLTDDKKRLRRIVFVENLFKLAYAGNPTALNIIMDRSDGKLAQSVTGEDGGPVVVKVEYGERR